MKQNQTPRPAPSPRLTSVKPLINNRLVDQLEHLLADAKRGELVGYIGVFIWTGDETTHGWSYPSTGLQFGLRRMVGETELLKTVLIQHIQED